MKRVEENIVLGKIPDESENFKLDSDAEETPVSMFGALKNKIKPFTREEREEMWKDSSRFN
jgi:hypothetical protein